MHASSFANAKLVSHVLDDFEIKSMPLHSRSFDRRDYNFILDVLNHESVDIF